jgi:pyridinium-3,5-bisthiocarboxylic acid mononucleotide nickel chelatase
MRTLYTDLVGGAAGDMLLGALIDAGAPPAELQQGLAKLQAAVAFDLRISKVERGFLQATRLQVVEDPDAPKPHRHLSDVLTLIDAARLPARAADRARRIFQALAVAEGLVHGIDPEQVHFHEVGAVDAIADVVGCCLALELLGVDRVISSPLPVGRGVTLAAHGELPLPAPATLALIEASGAMIEGASPGEHVTPTGAAILTTLAESFGGYPSLRVVSVGYGAGTRTTGRDGLPNVTRVVLGEELTPDRSGNQTADVAVLEANLDDQSPEHTAYLAQRLLEAGALDAFVTPVLMKKGRPAHVVTVLSPPALAGALGDLLLNESSTLGVRRRLETRWVLAREVRLVNTAHGEVRVKVATRPDGRRTYAPEYEDCARLARERSTPLGDVYAAALRACAE